MSTRWFCAGLLVLAGTGCGTRDRSEGARPDSSGDRSMKGMPGMEMGGRQPSEMMDQMREHLQEMAGATGDSLRRLMPMHRQMTANMLQEMDTDMRRMRMAGDSGWSALMDSIRQDLTRLPDVTQAELPGFMDRHRERVARLMDQHSAMMGHAR
jgi:hypothetical protein